MAIPDNAVLRHAKNVNVGDTICHAYSPYDYVVERIEARSFPFPQVRFYHGNDTAVSTYAPNERLYVLRHK